MLRRPTTERVTPESSALRVTFWQSLAAYHWACNVAEGRRVLDVGCGEGYGTRELARHARFVVGLDADATVLHTARRRYVAANLRWICGVADALPLRERSIDLLCCFQVLEHLAQPERFLREAYRVLAPRGQLLLTTPNRAAILSGVNPHHVREYDPESLHKLVDSVFDRVELLGVFPSERVAAYRAANRRTVEKILRLDRLQLHRRLPSRLRGELHALGTLLVRWWLNRRLHSLVEAITLEDFRVGEGDVTQAIDLVAVAWKDSE